MVVRVKEGRILVATGGRPSRPQVGCLHLGDLERIRFEKVVVGAVLVVGSGRNNRLLFLDLSLPAPDSSERLFWPLAMSALVSSPTVVTRGRLNFSSSSSSRSSPSSFTSSSSSSPSESLEPEHDPDEE